VRRWLLTPLVASLFIVSFVESWAALVHAARTAGIPYPEPWPWMVDGFIVAMALMVVEADRDHRGRVAWWPRAGLVAATALSVWIQVAYAPAEGRWLAAWSPLAVLFSFECLVFLWRPAWDEPVVPVRPEPVDPPVDPPDPEVPVAAPDDALVRTRRQRALTRAELVKVEPLIAQGYKAYGIANELKIPYPVVRQHVRNQELVSTNGDRS
jgi:hypothetical protein